MLKTLFKNLTAFFSIAIFTFAIASAASASTVTRSFSSTTPTAGTSLTVSLTINTVAPDTGYAIDENVPTGWVVTNPGVGAVDASNVIHWYVDPGASTVQQYTVTIPNTASGVTNFSGVYSFDFLTAPTILGQTSVNVQAVVPITTYTITATAGTNGAISPTGAVVVNSGANQTFAITPAIGYQVADVLVDGTSVGAVTTYTFTNVTTTHTIDASFSLIPVTTYTTTATAGTNGAISPTGAVVVNSGANQTFAITPAAGYQVADVLVDGTSVGAVTTYTFTNVTAAHSIAASFSLIPVVTYTITATAGANGAISPTGAVMVNAGANQTFAITPALGYQVATLTVDGAPAVASTSYAFINVTAIHTIDVTFSLIPILTTINVTPTSTSMLVGATQLMTATALDQSSLPFTTTVAWTSSDLTVGTIDVTTGLFTAVGVGTTTISATSGAVVGTTTITVLPDTIAPTTPDLLSATVVSSSQINLAWASSTDNVGIKEYRIYRNASTTLITATTTPFATTTQLSFSDTGLSPSTTYTYTVAAIDPAGNISGLATSTSATTPAAPVSSGGGGGFSGVVTPPYITAVNVPLMINQDQGGQINYSFSDGSKVTVTVPQGAISVADTFSVSEGDLTSDITPPNSLGAVVIGNKIFNINATPVRTFSLPLAISISLPGVTDISNISVYMLDSVAKLSQVMPGVVYDPATSMFKFSVNHLTTFALLRSTNSTVPLPPTKEVLGVKIYSDGSLLKGPDNKVYYIVSGQKFRILNLKELQVFVGRPIVKATQASLDQYLDFVLTKQVKTYKNGIVLRDKVSNKMFLVVDQKIKYIQNLKELVRLGKRTTVKVDVMTLMQYVRF